MCSGNAPRIATAPCREKYEYLARRDYNGNSFNEAAALSQGYQIILHMDAIKFSIELRLGRISEYFTKR